MTLYLMRHGIAYERSDWSGSDDARPLTDEGMIRTRAVAKALKKDKKPPIDAIWSSPLVRARQTAEIVGDVFGAKILEYEALSPGTNVKILTKSFSGKTPPDHVLFVGHEPDFGILLSDLVGEDDVHPFKKAGVACLKGEFKAGAMKLEWYLAPRDLLED
ncbi:MAG: phosphohistidine phosphatase SixA [Planctomycetota bacterium]|nr:phosphohistidine phosphatase SixA [Planctomycetota bacterium]